MAYLDKTGLTYFWSKIKGLLLAKADLDENGKILAEQLPNNIGGDASISYATEQQIINIFKS